MINVSTFHLPSPKTKHCDDDNNFDTGNKFLHANNLRPVRYLALREAHALKVYSMESKTNAV